MCHRQPGDILVIKYEPLLNYNIPSLHSLGLVAAVVGEQIHGDLTCSVQREVAGSIPAAAKGHKVTYKPHCTCTNTMYIV